MTKNSTRRAALLDLWDDDEEVQSLLKEKLPVEELERFDRDEASMQAEAVIAYCGSMEEFFRLHCRACGREFVASYARITTCSIRCLQVEVEKLGFDWNPYKSPEDRWRPKTVHLTEPLRRAKESLTDYQGRQENYQRHLRQYHPVPLIVPAEVVSMLDTIPQYQGGGIVPGQTSQDSSQPDVNL